MRKPSNTHIVSFVIRFVQNQPTGDLEPVHYRGAIRHIQTDQEVQFTDWDRAVDFIQQFISIDQPPVQLDKKNQNFHKGDSHAHEG
jgi:hypothetical protein